MKTEEAINFLKEKGYEIKKTESRFLEVQFSDMKAIFLQDGDGGDLIETYFDEKDFNDFEWFEEKNVGHFWIRGNIHNFEFLYKGQWIECDESMPVRFLK